MIVILHCCVVDVGLRASRTVVVSYKRPTLLLPSQAPLARLALVSELS
jgi:hypothetical protein